MGKIDFSKFSPKGILKDPIVVSIDEDCEEEYVFKCEGIPFMARGRIHAITGKVASGMSTFGLCLIRTCLTGNFGAICTIHRGPMKVLWIDTDQGLPMLGKKYYQLLERAEISHLPKDEIHSKIMAYSLLECFEITDKKSRIESAVNDFQPDFVFIDDLDELIEKPNQSKESAGLINWLESLAKKANCAICCSCHLNKNAKLQNGDYDLNEMEGYLGKFLRRRAADIFTLHKTWCSPTSTIKHAQCYIGRGRTHYNVHLIDGHILPED